jgi:hypothetical protein
LEERACDGFLILDPVNPEKRFQQLRTACEMAVRLHFLCASLATDTG